MFESQQPNLNFPMVRDIDPRDLLKEKAQVYMIDVRQPDEYVGELGHIAGSQLVVLDTLPQKLADIPTDKPIVFVCRSGGRSAKASAFAMDNGRKDVYNLKGGMLLWNDLHLPTEV